MVFPSIGTELIVSKHTVKLYPPHDDFSHHPSATSGIGMPIVKLSLFI